MALMAASHKQDVPALLNTVMVQLSVLKGHTHFTRYSYSIFRTVSVSVSVKLWHYNLLWSMAVSGCSEPV